MLLTQKIRIYPSEDQEQILWIFSEKCRLIFNFALAQRIDNWKENKKKSKEE
ncbi:MAG: helix-turn-helix domain-containing protein, partial [Candidatus Lokiarchaeota archaeon]|nr:helix-turn-helix domain-containing protein [Candidatus Lokiarchaeota archaeon]